MRVNLIDLNNKRIEELMLFYSQISRTETELEIHGNFDSTDSSRISATVLSYLPRHIFSVKFCGEYASIYHEGSYGDNEYAERNHLNSYYTYAIGEYLSDHVKSLPDTVRSLSLHFSNSYDDDPSICCISSLHESIIHLPDGITELDLTGTNIQHHQARDLLKHAPKTLRTVRLSDEYRLITQHILPTIRNGIDRVYLNHVVIDENSGYDIFFALDRKITHLGLQINQQFQAAEPSISAAFSKLPPGLIDFDLRKNQLGRKSCDVLRSIFAKLPPRLVVFGLSENEFANLSVTDMAFVLQGLQGSINELDLGDNDLLLKEESDLDTILMGLPKTIKKLRLCEKKPNGMSGMQLANRLRYLPAHIETFSISDSNLFGLPVNEVVIALSGLQETITTIDFSYSGLDQKTGAELAELFSGLPTHIRKIKVSFNRLAYMDLNTLKQGFEVLRRTVIEIDLSDNGFDSLLPSQLSRFLDIIPETLGQINLDENQFGIRNGGTIMSVRNTYNPHHLRLQHKFRHQKQFASLRLVMMQIVQSTSINIDLACHIFSYLVDPLLLDIKYKASLRQQINTTFVTAKPPVIITQSMQNTCIAMVRYRIDSLNCGATRLDLSRCGLNRIHDAEQLIELFKLIPRGVYSISFRGNGFQYDEKGRQAFIEAIKALPQQIVYLNLSDNYFEFDNFGRLAELMTPIPSTVKYISLAHERPVSPAEHLARVKSYKNFHAMTAHSSNAMEKATMILKEYIQETSLFFRFFTTDQNRYHKNEITRIIRWIDNGIITNIIDLSAMLQHLPVQKKADSLASRIGFILQFEPSSIRAHVETRGLLTGLS